MTTKRWGRHNIFRRRSSIVGGGFEVQAVEGGGGSEGKGRKRHGYGGHYGMFAKMTIGNFVVGERTKSRPTRLAINIGVENLARFL